MAAATTTPKTVTIEISVDPEGVVRIKPYYAEAYIGDSLVWRARDERPWAIGFKRATPTDASVIHGNGGLMDRPHTAARKGHYPYVAALVGPAMDEDRSLRGLSTVYLEAACPEIIIKEYSEGEENPNP